MRTLARPGEETEHITVGLADLAGGEELRVDEPGQEVAVVILSGIVSAAADGNDLGRAGGRASVFEGPGDAVYAPAGAPLSIRADGDAQVAVITAAAGEDPAGEARVIRAEDQRIQEVGQGNWSRTVRTMLGPEHQASRLLLGETINPPGNWSSYPPHRHDRQQPPEEVALEEVYLFKVDPSSGFGVQIMYDEAGQERAFVVRDDDVAAIRSGYHPVVAASGYTLYYLWVLAGAGREMIPHLDPDHAWVQQANGG